MSYRKLLDVVGVTGYERLINNIISDKLQEKFINVSNDNIGNLIGFIEGKKENKKTILVLAHMDEVGIQVTSIKEDGRIRGLLGNCDLGNKVSNLKINTLCK